MCCKRKQHAKSPVSSWIRRIKANETRAGRATRSTVRRDLMTTNGLVVQYFSTLSLHLRDAARFVRKREQQNLPSSLYDLITVLPYRAPPWDTSKTPRGVVTWINWKLTGSENSNVAAPLHRSVSHSLVVRPVAKRADWTNTHPCIFATYEISKRVSGLLHTAYPRTDHVTCVHTRAHLYTHIYTRIAHKSARERIHLHVTAQHTRVNGIHVCAVWNISYTWELDITKPRAEGQQCILNSH